MSTFQCGTSWNGRRISSRRIGQRSRMTRTLMSKDVMKSWELWYNFVSHTVCKFKSRNLKLLSPCTSRNVICRNANQREREVVEGITRLTELVRRCTLPLDGDLDMLGLRYEASSVTFASSQIPPSSQSTLSPTHVTPSTCAT